MGCFKCFKSMLLSNLMKITWTLYMCTWPYTALAHVYMTMVIHSPWPCTCTVNVAMVIHSPCTCVYGHGYTQPLYMCIWPWLYTAPVHVYVAMVIHSLNFHNIITQYEYNSCLKLQIWSIYVKN